MIAWLMAHPFWVFMLIAFGATCGLVVGAMLAAAGNADASDERQRQALRERMTRRDGWPS